MHSLLFVASNGTIEKESFKAVVSGKNGRSLYCSLWSIK